MKDERLALRCRALKLLLSDVDGVMTDGTVLLLPEGGEAKAFHIRDGLGIVLAHTAGLKTGLALGTSLGGRVPARRGAGHGRGQAGGASTREPCSSEILASEGLEAHEVAYIGDDLNDLSVMGAVGLSAAPRDAAFEVRAEAFMVLEAEGGRGCLREFIEAILKARGDWDVVASAFGLRP